MVNVLFASVYIFGICQIWDCCNSVYSYLGILCCSVVYYYVLSSIFHSDLFFSWSLFMYFEFFGHHYSYFWKALSGNSSKSLSLPWIYYFLEKTFYLGFVVVLMNLTHREWHYCEVFCWSRYGLVGRSLSL